MFQKLMNNFYYGKSGKADMTPDDLPTTRWQLFWEMLRIRLSALVRLNLMYMICWLPAMLVLLFSGMSLLTSLAELAEGVEGALPLAEVVNTIASGALVLLIPCIAITGPFTAGVAFVTRNWARDEHAFIWSDFKDAAKENWKQALLTSCITGIAPFLLYTCWNFYSAMAATNAIMFIPQALTMMLGFAWALVVTYMYPLMVTYDLSFGQLVRNAFLLAIGRLPTSVGVRLLHCIPALIALIAALFFSAVWAVLGLFLYYLVIGFSLSRFISASATNAVMDKYINSKIEGAVVNRGLRVEEDDDDDEDEDSEN